MKRIKEWWRSRYAKISWKQLNLEQFAYAMCNHLGKEVTIEGVYTGQFLGKKMTSAFEGTLKEVERRQFGENNVFGVVLMVEGEGGTSSIYFDEKFIQKRQDDRGKPYYFLAQKDDDFHHFEIRIKEKP